MIEMQYNFPLLAETPAEWRTRLRAAVDELGDEDFDEMRPTFRLDTSAMMRVAATWLKQPAERTYLIEGVHHGTLIAMMASGLAGRTIAVDALAYTGALDQARALGSPLVGCSIDGEGMTAEGLHEACTNAAKTGHPVRGLYLTPTVHNPLGSTATLARRKALVEVAREFDLVIIEDNAYGYMDPDAPVAVAALAPERTFFVDGLSKSYAPAARTGFITAPETQMPKMISAIKNTATGASLPHARAAIGIIADGTLDRVIAAKNIEGELRNLSAREILGDRCHLGARCAWHLWISLPENVSPQVFEKRMCNRGVQLSGGNWFAVGKGAPNGFRIALGGEVDRERAMEGVALVAEELAKL